MKTISQLSRYLCDIKYLKSGLTFLILFWLVVPMRLKESPHIENKYRKSVTVEIQWKNV